jgi:hypothetical protein
VTHTESWKVIWRAPFPGLETRSGTLALTPSGTMLLQMPAVNLAAWTSDPALRLAPGDVVTFSNYQAPAGSPQVCTDLANIENQAPARFSLVIASLPNNDTLELLPFQPAAGVRGFDISVCPGGLGVVAAVRSGGANPWLVFGGGTVRGRTATGGTFIAPELRFDYPLDYTTDALPVIAGDTAVAFTLGGVEPNFTGAGWSFALGSGLTPQVFRDTTQTQGLATVVTAYSSQRHAQLVFSSITGQNTVVQADPALLTSDINGVISYK